MTNPKVDAFIAKQTQWAKEMAALRKLLLENGLTEEIKWGKPCYSFNDANIAILQGFKNSVALMFFKGAVMDDPAQILEKPGDNSQAARRIPFTDVAQIKTQAKQLKAYIQNAIAVEQAGLEVTLKKSPEPMPEELLHQFQQLPQLKTAFESLTPGRQRAYILFISGAKQSQTRTSRIEKHIERILAGKGLND